MTPRPVEEEMLDRLQGQPGAGTFEAHVTVEAADAEARDRFRAACAELGVKSVLIELAHGVNPSQPMTSSYHKGELPAVLAEVAGLARGLRQRGFAVTRVKLEALVGNEGVPRTDEEARAMPAGNYFEFHVKVTLPAGADVAPLKARCRELGAHLSSNAFRREADGRTHRFVTQRVHGVGRVTALAEFERLLAALSADGHVLSNRLREYTVHDSNAALDAGWIDAPGAEGRP